MTPDKYGGLGKNDKSLCNQLNYEEIFLNN